VSIELTTIRVESDRPQGKIGEKIGLYFAHARLPLRAVRALVIIERAQIRYARTRYSARAASDFSVTGLRRWR